MKRFLIPLIASCFVMACGEDVHSIHDQDSPGIDDPNINNPDDPNINNPDDPNINNPDDPNINNPDDPNINNPDDPNINNPDDPNINNPDDPNINNPDDPNINNSDGPNTNNPDDPNINNPDDPNTHEPTLPGRPIRPDLPTPIQPDNPPAQQEPDNPPAQQEPDNPDDPLYTEPDDFIPFTYETVDLPAGQIIDHEGKPVKISSIKMMRGEVTIGQYWECLARGKCIHSDIHIGGGNQFFTIDYSDEYSYNYGLLDDHLTPPVRYIRYSGAVHFCEWLGGRLPTEAEWEYAALFDGNEVRNVSYPWGDEAPQFCVHASFDPQQNIGCISWTGEVYSSSKPYSEKYGIYTLGTFPKGQTPTGLAHMAGNVAEYVAEYEENVPGYDHYSCPRYIVKGGSALTTADKLKIRERGYIHNCYYEPAATQAQREMMRFEVTGFRCVFDN